MQIKTRPFYFEANCRRKDGTLLPRQGTIQAVDLDSALVGVEVMSKGWSNELESVKVFPLKEGGELDTTRQRAKRSTPVNAPKALPAPVTQCENDGELRRANGLYEYARHTNTYPSVKRMQEAFHD